MKTFTYPLLAKLVYRYANIPVTLILAFYLFISAVSLRFSYVHLFGVIINSVLIFIINRYYFNSYKILPYKIDAYDDKLIGSDFSFQNKVIEIKFSEIQKISGGIFSGAQTKPIKIFDGTNTIAFSTHIKNYNELLTFILSKVKKEIYENLLNEMTKIAEQQKEKIKRRS